MKHLKYFEDYFLNEGQITNSDGVHPEFYDCKLSDGQIIKIKFNYLNLKERTATYQLFKNSPATQSPGKKLKERGPDLINKAVMAKPTEQLNVNIDSERLEYAWRYISENLDKVLTDKKIEIKGILIADNILQEGENVVFNFTFKDKDSVQNTDPSGKTTKKILAGKIEIGDITPGKRETVTVTEKQVWVVSPMKMVSNNPTSNNKTDIDNNIIENAAQGMFNEKGTYWYVKPQTGFWCKYKTPADISAKMLEDPNNKLYFDEPLLYKKLGIDPTTKKVVTPDPNVIIK